jgi:hypothetical protein
MNGFTPTIRQREIASRQEKEQVMGLTTRGFNWETIKFKNQYFKKEDYLTFSNSKGIAEYFGGERGKSCCAQ